MSDLQKAFQILKQLCTLNRAIIFTVVFAFNAVQDYLWSHKLLINEQVVISGNVLKVAFDSPVVTRERQ